MNKFFVLFLTLLVSFSSLAEDCASTTSQLRDLVGNNGLPMTWVEDTKNIPRQLTLKLGNAEGVMSLKLTTPGGLWASVTGQICKLSDTSFVARVSTMEYGPQAPGLVKTFAGKLKTINLTLPYPNVLKVKAKGMSFTFSPR